MPGFSWHYGHVRGTAGTAAMLEVQRSAPHSCQGSAGTAAMLEVQRSAPHSCLSGLLLPMKPILTFLETALGLTLTLALTLTLTLTLTITLTLTLIHAPGRR